MANRKGLGIFDATGQGKLPPDVSEVIKVLETKQSELTDSLANNTFTDDQRKELADLIFAEEKAAIEKVKTDVSEMQKAQITLTNTVQTNLEDIVEELKYNKQVVQDPLVALGILQAQA
jgi:hypothetical protein